MFLHLFVGAQEAELTFNLVAESAFWSAVGRAAQSRLASGWERLAADSTLLSRSLGR